MCYENGYVALLGVARSSTSVCTVQIANSSRRAQTRFLSSVGDGNVVSLFILVKERVKWLLIITVWLNNTKFHVVHSNCNPHYANDAFGRSKMPTGALATLVRQRAGVISQSAPGRSSHSPLPYTWSLDSQVIRKRKRTERATKNARDASLHEYMNRLSFETEQTKELVGRPASTQSKGGGRLTRKAVICHSIYYVRTMSPPYIVL